MATKRTAVGVKDVQDAELGDVQLRRKYAGRCGTAMYVSIAAVPTAVFVWVGAAGVVGLVGLGLGISGLRGLKQVGPGPAPDKARRGAERLASRLARSAPSKAWTAVWLGGILGISCLALVALRILVAAAQGG